MSTEQPNVTTYYSYQKTTETKTTQSRSQTPQRIDDLNQPRRSIQEILSLPTQRSHVYSTHSSQVFPTQQSQTSQSQVFPSLQSQAYPTQHSQVQFLSPRTTQYSQLHLPLQQSQVVQTILTPSSVRRSQQIIRTVTTETRSTSQQPKSPLITDRSVSQSSLSSIHNRRTQRLTEHPMIIPFLMGVEIERLLNENDKLKFRLKECDDAYLDRKSYESQIKNLQSRLDIAVIAQRQIDELKNEIVYWKGRYESFDKNLQVKLSVEEKKNQEMLEEIERLRLKLRNAEEEKFREFQQIREQYENERKIYVEKEITIITSQFSNDRQFLENELRKQKEANQAKTRELDDLKNILQQSDTNAKRVKDLEGKGIILQNDNDRLNRNLTQKLEETEQWKSKYRKLENQLNELQNNHPKIEAMQNQLDSADQELEKLRFAIRNKSLECDDLSNQNTKLIVKLKQENDYIKELEEKNRLQSEEIDRLNHLVRQRSLENDDLKQRTITTENSYHLLIEETEIKLRQLVSSEAQMREKEKQLNELDSRYKNLLNELDRLNGIIKQKDSLNENLKNRLSAVEKEFQGLQQQYEQEHMDNQKNIEKLIAQLNEKSAHLDDLLNKYDQLYQAHLEQDRNIKMMKEEHHDALNSKAEEIQDLRNMNDDLRLQLSQIQQRLSSVSDLSQKRIRELEGQISNLREEFSTLQVEKEQLEANQTLLKYDLRETALALDNCRSRINAQDQIIQNNDEEIERLKKQIEDLKRQIQELLDHIAYLEKYEENIRILSKEIDRLNDQLRQDEEELKGWRLQYSEEGSLTKKIQDQQCIMVILMTELESVRRLVFDKESEVEGVRKSLLDPYRK